MPTAVPARPAAATSKPKSPAEGKVKRETPARDWFSVNYLCLILAGISFLLYANTLTHGYILDDVMVLKDNLLVKQGIKATAVFLPSKNLFRNRKSMMTQPANESMLKK